MPIILGGVALQTIEALFHLIAVVDAERMQAGHATPVFSTHMFLGAVGYPVFAVVAIALIIAGARTRTLGRWWIAPLGILGAFLPGLAGVLVIWLGMPVGVFFAGIAFFGMWATVVALLPERAPAEGKTPFSGRSRRRLNNVARAGLCQPFTRLYPCVFTLVSRWRRWRKGLATDWPIRYGGHPDVVRSRGFVGLSEWENRALYSKGAD